MLELAFGEASGKTDPLKYTISLLNQTQTIKHLNLHIIGTKRICTFINKLKRSRATISYCSTTLIFTKAFTSDTHSSLSWTPEQRTVLRALNPFVKRSLVFIVQRRLKDLLWFRTKLTRRNLWPRLMAISHNQSLYYISNTSLYKYASSRLHFMNR